MFGSGAKLSHWVFTHQIIIPYDLLSRFGIVAEGGDLEGNFCPPEEEIYIFLSKGPLHSTFADFRTEGLLLSMRAFSLLSDQGPTGPCCIICMFILRAQPALGCPSPHKCAWRHNFRLPHRADESSCEGISEVFMYIAACDKQMYSATT